MSEKHIFITDFNGNPNLGLYAFATDSYCLVGRGLPEAELAEIKKTLNVPVHVISICGTSMTGVFLAGNSNKLLVPSIAFEEELKQLDELNIDYEIIHTKLTALGNNILCNDAGAIVNPEFEERVIDEIKEKLGVPVITSMISELEIVGSLAVLNSRGFCLVHDGIKDFEKKLLEKHLKVKCRDGTVNMGSPYVNSGIIVNKNGFAIGSFSGGPEIDNADKALGFLIE